MAAPCVSGLLAERPAVLHEVDGGDGRERLQPAQQGEEEVDQGHAGGALADRRRAAGRMGDLEGAILEGAAEVEAALGRQRQDGGVEGVAEGWPPGAVEGKDAGHDVEERPRLVDAARVRDAGAGAAQAADGGGLLAGVLEVRGVQGLLDLEDCVDALRWNVMVSVAGEEQRGVLAVVDHQVDLLALAAVGVDDEGPARLVPAWEGGRPEWRPREAARL